MVRVLVYPDHAFPSRALRRWRYSCGTSLPVVVGIARGAVIRRAVLVVGIALRVVLIVGIALGIDPIVVRIAGGVELVVRIALGILVRRVDAGVVELRARDGSRVAACNDQHSGNKEGAEKGRHYLKAFHGTNVFRGWGL